MSWLQEPLYKLLLTSVILSVKCESQKVAILSPSINGRGRWVRGEGNREMLVL